jgi:hypothetical protein
MTESEPHDAGTSMPGEPAPHEPAPFEPVPPDPQPSEPAPPGSATERLLRQQDRLRQEFLRLRTELDSPQARELRRGLRQGGRIELAEGLTEILESVEGALRSVRALEGVLRSPEGAGTRPYPDLPSELPLRLRQFLDERRRKGRLEWTLQGDPLRGWVLRWKECTQEGNVRGSGRLYERPHAWIND